MALSVVTAQADPGNGKAKGHAMQIQIDKKTGRKTLPDDSVQTSTETASRVADDSATTLMPLEGRLLPSSGAGTGQTAQIGLRQMKFMTITIDENGNRHVDHKTLDEIESDTTESAAAKGEK
jgi:hypothetical protein